MEQNLFKQSAKIMRDNLIVMQPLFFWVLIIMLIIRPLLSKNAFDLSFIFTSIIAILCSTAFLSGWYNCVKYTVSIKNETYETIEERNKFQLNILKSFFPGVTEYMLPVTIAAIIYAGIGYGLMECFRYITDKIFVVKQFPQEFFEVLNKGTQNEISHFIQYNLSQEQVLAVSLMILGGILLYVLFNLFILWFAPAIIYTSKNPFVALYNALKFLFKNLGMSILIIIIMFAINFSISFLNLLIGNNFLAFIPLLLTFFYLTYYVITVFVYYESKTQNNSTNGTECIREV